MLPAEFKIEEWRFSFRRHTSDGKGWVYGGSKKVNGVYVFVSELAVKTTMTKPCMHRLFVRMDELTK